MKRTLKPAFTLVELLVVIGIIALLISILLPSLNKAREASKRVVCMSNMRELYTEMRIYAAENRDVCPIGYLGSEKAFSYIMNWCHGSADPPKPTQMGLLVTAGISKNPKAFYCPSETQDTQYTYQPNPKPSVGPYSDNPWPFATVYQGATPNGQNPHTRLGFSARPVAHWPANGAPGGFNLGSNPKGSPLYWLPSDGFGRLDVPRFSKLKNLALLADTCYSKPKVVSRHRTGLNVLYGSGSAHFVIMSPKTFDKAPWNTMGESTAFDPANNATYLKDGKWDDGSTIGTLLPPYQWGGFWVDLDRS